LPNYALLKDEVRVGISEQKKKDQKKINDTAKHLMAILDWPANFDGLNHH